MVQYCEKCREFHETNEMCPQYKQQLQQHPEWLAEAADFAMVAGEYKLVTSQALDGVAKGINNLVGSNLSYEGTHQAARDIQVFAKLNSDSFRNSGQFANAQTAQETFKNSSEGFQRYLRGRLNGTGEEVDWLRSQQGKLSSILKKSTLPDGNTPGWDGETVNRFTGKIIEHTSIKSAEGSAGLYTNAKDVVEALQKGTLSPNDAITGVKGTSGAINKALDKAIAEANATGDSSMAQRLQSAKNNLKVNEMGTHESVKESTERLTEKIANGQANITITPDMVASKAAQGAVIGAAISLTISSIVNFIRYKNGEITRNEAFRDVGEDVTKGLLVGGAMGAITLFLPGGAIGFVAGMAIGMYIGEVAGNVLDEVFGKGAYEQILHACGYITGTAKNVAEMMREYGDTVKSMAQSNSRSRETLHRVAAKAQSNQRAMDELNLFLEDL